MRPLPELLDIATEAVGAACEIIRSHDPGTLTAKGDRDMATEVDYAVERALREMLASRTPEIGVLGEEEGATGDTGGGTFWSLDGTVNFVHGLPLCAVSLGLVAGDRSVVGVIELPFLRERYAAYEGGGAHHENRRCGRLDEALVAVGDFAIGAGAAIQNPARARLLELLAANVQRVRMVGSAAIGLSWVASGRLDACVLHSNLPWDTSAGTLIAREAGVAVLDLDGSPHTLRSRGTVAAAKPIADRLVELVAAAGV